MTVKVKKKELIRTLLLEGRTYNFIASKAGCSKSTISSVQHEYNMPNRIKSDNSTKKSTKKSTQKIHHRNLDIDTKFLWRVAWNMLGESFDAMRKTRKLTKLRFMAEMVGYSGKSLTVDGYCNVIHNAVSLIQLRHEGVLKDV